MSLAVVPFITTALSVYSLGKGLKEGNFMQAAIGAFGAYSGMANLTGAAAAGGGVNEAAMSGLGTDQASMLAEQTLDFGSEGLAMTGEALGAGEDLIGMLDTGMADVGAYEGLVGSGAPEVAVDAASGGVLEGIGDTVSGGLESLQEMVGQFFNPQTGQVTNTATAGSTPITMANLKELAPMIMKGAGMFMKYKGQEDMREEEQKRYETSRADMERERANRSATVSTGSPSPLSFLSRTKNKQTAGVL